MTFPCTLPLPLTISVYIYKINPTIAELLTVTHWERHKYFSLGMMQAQWFLPNYFSGVEEFSLTKNCSRTRGIDLSGFSPSPNSINIEYLFFRQQTFRKFWKGSVLLYILLVWSQFGLLYTKYYSLTLSILHGSYHPSFQMLDYPFKYSLYHKGSEFKV